MNSDRAPQPGDWVLVWGQLEENRPHPDDLVVEFHSHSDSWSGIVRKDRVEFPDHIPSDVPRCAALMKHIQLSGALIQCALYHRHPGDHKDQYARLYTDDLVVGYIEVP